jgi:hypothetical protein
MDSKSTGLEEIARQLGLLLALAHENAVGRAALPRESAAAVTEAIGRAQGLGIELPTLSAAAPIATRRRPDPTVQLVPRDSGVCSGV